jgi:hypothetical protein
MNLNESCSTDAFLIKSCLDVFRAFYFLQLKPTSNAYQTEVTFAQT